MGCGEIVVLVLLVEVASLLLKIAQKSSEIKKWKHRVIQKSNFGQIAKITDSVTWQDACTCMYVPCGMIHNSQDVEQAKCSLTDKQTKKMQYIIQAYLVFSVSYGLHG